MLGWIIPPPKPPTKTEEVFEEERRSKVDWLVSVGLLRSEGLKKAMLKVPREKFIPMEYRDYAYEEVPLPLPGRSATISCPHSYPLFYEAIELKRGDRLLEVGAGSGYGAALAREVVGEEGLVVTVEIDRETHAFAKRNLEKLGYSDIVLILGDGSEGYPPLAPYTKVVVTASCPSIPKPLLDQLALGGKLAAPVDPPHRVQKLVLATRGVKGLKFKVIDEVLYVPLRGRFGWIHEP